MNLSELKPNPNNPRKIDPKKLKALKKSMLEFGDLGGIVFNHRTGQLIGGHQRLKVLTDLKSGTVIIDRKRNEPTKNGTLNEGHIEIDGESYAYREVDWDEAKEKAANIAANKGAGEWDDLKLGEWFRDLDAMDFDLSLTMFDEEEMAPFLKAVEVVDPEETPLGDSEGMPEDVETRCKPGDIWLLGEHRIMCGDSTDPTNIDTLIGKDVVDTVHTDPPYGIGERGDRSSRDGGNSLVNSGVFKDFKDDTTQYAIDAFNYVSCLDIKNQVWWGANYYAHSVPETASWIIWDKRVEENQHDNNSDCEMAWVKSKWSAVRIFRHLWKGLMKDSERAEKRVHPTQKPVALAEWCFDTYFKGDVKIVLDLFLGSGSTLIACEKTKRKCLGMEIDPHYCDVVISRWEKYTGKTAIHNPE